MLEDDPHFNAGRGAVFTYRGHATSSTRRSWTGAPRRRRGHRGHRDAQSGQPRPRGDGEQPARLPQPRGRRPLLARAGPRAGGARMVRDRRAPPPARGAEGARDGRLFRRGAQIWHGRRGRGRRRTAMSPRRPRPAA